MVRSYSQRSQLKRIWGKIHQKLFKNTVFQVSADGKVKIKTKKKKPVEIPAVDCITAWLFSAQLGFSVSIVAGFPSAASHMDDHVFICFNISEQVTACPVISTIIC